MTVDYECQLIICVFLLLSIVFTAICRHRKNKDKDKDRGVKQTLCDAIIAFSIFILVLILINACFLIAKNINFMGESVLKYNEAQQMVVSALVAGCIAFFQFEIQQAINEKNKKETEQREQFHIKEIKSDRIKEMQICNELSAYALNFNIPSCRVIYEKQYNRLLEAKYFIRISATNERQQIHPHYFKPNAKDAEGGYGIKAEVIGLNENKYKCVICSEYIDISFVGGFEELNYFFTTPTIVDGEQSALAIKVTYSGSDTSYDDKKYSRLKFSLDFQLVPSGGYDENGKFVINVVNPLITAHSD